ncbi:hypothetical protein [Aliarcobacter thereius]|uniref:hypothetical protein n=1 Tax=Aliarcobacter thereius TaxID=544718 RepID=UPI000826D2A3|nr:hypothetical protein [Aliarcobacter thereius]
MSVEIKIQINNSDYIIISNCFINGIEFKMHSKGKDGIVREFNDGKSSCMRVSQNYLDNFINTLQKIQFFIGLNEKS